MEIEKVHSQIGKFTKDPKTNEEKYTQIYAENTDKDVLIETNNPNIPENTNTLSDIVGNLGSQAFVTPKADYANIYHGNGAPTTAQVSEPKAGDLYVNNLTGEIYQYMGVEEPYSEGGYKIPLSESSYKFIFSGNTIVASADVESGNGAGVGASNINLSAIFDGNDDTSAVIPKTNHIVFDFGESVRLQKIILHYKNFPTYYKQTKVQISDSLYSPELTQYNSENYMDWTTMVDGLQSFNFVDGLVDSVDASGSGCMTINISPTNTLSCRFISIGNNSSNIDGLSGIELYAKIPSNVVNGGKWVRRDISPNQTVIGRLGLYEDTLCLMNPDIKLQENQIIPVYITSTTTNGLNDITHIKQWNGKTYDDLGKLQIMKDTDHEGQYIDALADLYTGVDLAYRVVYLQYVFCKADKAPEFRVVHDPTLEKLYSLILNNHQIAFKSYSKEEIKNLVNSAWT